MRYILTTAIFTLLLFSCGTRQQNTEMQETKSVGQFEEGRGKKVLVISSSPRKGGNSDTLCDEFIKGAEETGHRVLKIFLNDYDIKFYTDQSYAPQRLTEDEMDDAQKITLRMVEADVIVMATPVYYYSMSGQMKTFIDRTFDRFMEINDKDFYFIITSADTEIELMAPVMAGFQGFLDCLKNPTNRGVIYGNGARAAGDVRKLPAMQEAYNAGKES